MLWTADKQNHYVLGPTSFFYGCGICLLPWKEKREVCMLLDWCFILCTKFLHTRATAAWLGSRSQLTPFKLTSLFFSVTLCLCLVHDSFFFYLDSCWSLSCVWCVQRPWSFLQTAASPLKLTVCLPFWRTVIDWYWYYSIRSFAIAIVFSIPFAIYCLSNKRLNESSPSPPKMQYLPQKRSWVNTLICTHFSKLIQLSFLTNLAPQSCSNIAILSLLKKQENVEGIHSVLL